MATKQKIFPITFQYNAYKAHALIRDLTITNKITRHFMIQAMQFVLRHSRVITELGVFHI